MRRFLTVVTAAFAVVAFSSMVFAQAATSPTAKTTTAAEKTTAKPATAAAAPQAEKTTTKATKPAAMSASGKVAKVDEATKTLVVTTKTGDKDFMLGADTKIMSGAKTVTAAELSGKTVKVTYHVADGKNVASKVTVAAEPKTSTAAKTPTEKK